MLSCLSHSSGCMYIHVHVHVYTCTDVHTCTHVAIEKVLLSPIIM